MGVVVSARSNKPNWNITVNLLISSWLTVPMLTWPSSTACSMALP
jgi:hypothetical protein